MALKSVLATQYVSSQPRLQQEILPLKINNARRKETERKVGETFKDKTTEALSVIQSTKQNKNKTKLKRLWKMF